MPDQVPAEIFMSHHKYPAVATAILHTHTFTVLLFFYLKGYATIVQYLNIFFP